MAPTPEPHRLLPSLNDEQANPDLQSESVEQVSHSPPLEQEVAGRAVRAGILAAYSAWMLLTYIVLVFVTLVIFNR